MPTIRLALVLALACLAAACGERAPSTPAPAALAEQPPEVAAPPPGVAPTDAVVAPGVPPPAAPSPADGQVAPAAPAPAGAAASPVASVIRQAVALAPQDATTALAPDGETVVDPGAGFRVVLAISSTDARMLLLDAKDALVAAEGANEVGPTTRLILRPSAPLVPGGRYTLRIDGASTRELHDASGQAFTPAVYALRVAGEPPPPPPKEKPAPRKRRR